MSTFIGHGFIGLSLGSFFLNRKNRIKIIILSVVASILPDVDVLCFRLGIPYNSVFGHRGFTHSICFSVLVGILFSLLVVPPNRKQLKLSGLLFLNFSTITLSHALLDAMTNGGSGCAFFAPFNNQRYFLPWQPLQVSPMVFWRFLRYGGGVVLIQELQYLIVPSTLLVVFNCFRKKYKAKQKKDEQYG